MADNVFSIGVHLIWMFLVGGRQNSERKHIFSVQDTCTYGALDAFSHIFC